MSTRRLSRFLCIFAVACLLLPSLTWADYLKLDPPPDANKPTSGADLSCWLATAANMLAGAGYGTGDTVQERAEEIYEELKASPEMVG